MKEKRKFHFKAIFVLLLASLFLYSCDKDDNKTTETSEKTMNQLDIPEEFDFETTREVTISFQSTKSTKDQDTIKYKIYLYGDLTNDETRTYEDEEGNTVTDNYIAPDLSNDLIASKVSSTGGFELTASIPEYIDKLYVTSNNKGVFSSEVLNIVNNKAYSYGSKNGSAVSDDPVDVLYGVNGSADIFTINPETGEMVIIDELTSGSYTCAIDDINRKLYTVGKNKNLYVFDLDSQEIDLVGYLGMGGPRLDYNEADGLLYFSTKDVLYTIDPSNANVIAQKTIEGLHNLTGGDLIYDVDGTLYMCTFSGLYKVIFNEEEATAVRISAENLPFSPTSMTIDSNGELWLATNDKKLVIMDRVTGGWQYMFDTYDVHINDLTTLPLDENAIPQTDTDGDGTIDFYDEYPEDGEKAYNTYTPSIYGVGSLAFEDNWPEKGDYDFNDLVVNYQFITVMNSDDEAIELQCNYTIKHLGASYTNGFGVMFPFDESIIESVTGYNITSGLVNVNSKGLETGQSNPVVIVCDNVNDNAYQELFVKITFNEPIASDVIGVPPFNPFIFINEDRSREVHMPGNAPTDLADASLFGSSDDDSNPATGRYYRTSNNLPWAIHISHEFRYPMERVAINQGYLKFNEWAESGGSIYEDWYTDVDGYRNASSLNLN